MDAELPVAIGFTGTRAGMTDAQKASVLLFLDRYHQFIAHHGACAGADEEFDQIARYRTGFCAMVVHPSTLRPAPYSALSEADIVHTPRPPLVRNRDIVAGSELLIATPKEDHMVTRSGTWATVRYALSADKPVYVVVPSGGLIRWFG